MNTPQTANGNCCIHCGNQLTVEVAEGGKVPGSSFIRVPLPADSSYSPRLKPPLSTLSPVSVSVSYDLGFTPGFFLLGSATVSLRRLQSRLLCGAPWTPSDMSSRTQSPFLYEFPQGRDRKTRIERRIARRARQQSRRRARGTRTLNTPKEMIFEKDGVRGVLIALETDHGAEFPDANTALTAARESFSDLECEDAVQFFFSLGVNEDAGPFAGWEALDVPRARLPKTALYDITVCALHTVQAIHTIICLFGRILAQRWQQHGRETPLTWGARGRGGLLSRAPVALHV
ncbi:hypothetical protein DFH08DRAFT_929365 [Mycena albidolilacea]|uniref:Uncharacterized protein n=1 Tax=Mycena albidolilacea TaxID=1033008 RepID=A0AAD7AR93_9AGAR|nr:hypothetical protein DFH08DRAFT_929365 [Mycena albidolilacea]